MNLTKSRLLAGALCGLALSASAANACIDRGLAGTTVVLINNCGFPVIGSFRGDFGASGGFVIDNGNGGQTGIYAKQTEPLHISYCNHNDWNKSKCKLNNP